jgi:cytochrome c5
MNALSKMLLGLSLVALASCAGAPTPIPDSDSPEAKVYEAKCSICHSLPHPRRQTYAEWEKIVPVMEKEMQFKKLPPLTQEEKSTILSYLEKHAR